MDTQATAKEYDHGIEIGNGVILGQVCIVRDLIRQGVHTFREETMKANLPRTGWQYGGY